MNIFGVLAISAAMVMPCAFSPSASGATLATTFEKPAGASSFLTGHVAANAVSSGTAQAAGWVASTSQFPQWLVVDLGAIYDVTSITQTFANSDSWFYKIEGSNDNVVYDSYWTTLADNTRGVIGTSFTNAVSGKFRYIRIYIAGSGASPASSVGFTVKGTLAKQDETSVPTPQPANTGEYIVGSQSCNLWANNMDWTTLSGYADRVSIMGSYDEAYDVSTDWQIKMAVEHGISYMQGCWFRQAGNEGSSTVMASYDHFLNSLANTAHYRSMLKFSIDWINTGPGVGTTSGLADFEKNLVPYWINTYFNKPNYLKLGGKPVLAIYDFEGFIGQMGSLENARAAISYFRAAVAAAGFPGLILETQQSGSTTPADHWVIGKDPRGVNAQFGNLYTANYSQTNSDAAAAGFNCVFAYHVPTFTDLMVSSNPDDAQVSAEQEQAWSNWQSYSALPSIVSVSMGWNAAPWKENNKDSWRLTPADFQSLLVSAKSAMKARTGVIGRMILLDSWNEYGEGHYIAPTATAGYGYLDAVGAVFSPNWPATVPSSIDTQPDVSTIPQVSMAQ